MQLQVVSYRLCSLPILIFFVKSVNSYLVLLLALSSSLLFPFSFCVLLLIFRSFFSSPFSFFWYLSSQFFFQVNHKSSKTLHYILQVYFRTFEPLKVDLVYNKQPPISLLFVPSRNQKKIKRKEERIEKKKIERKKHSKEKTKRRNFLKN